MNLLAVTRINPGTGEREFAVKLGDMATAWCGSPSEAEAAWRDRFDRAMASLHWHSS